MFRGALDAEYTIEAMKVAAARAIAARVHDDELGGYIVPSVFMRGVAPGVAAAVRQAAGVGVTA